MLTATDKTEATETTVAIAVTDAMVEIVADEEVADGATTVEANEAVVALVAAIEISIQNATTAGLGTMSLATTQMKSATRSNSTFLTQI
jgi:hypothetical protein